MCSTLFSCSDDYTTDPPIYQKKKAYQDFFIPLPNPDTLAMLHQDSLYQAYVSLIGQIGNVSIQERLDTTNHKVSLLFNKEKEYFNQLIAKYHFPITPYFYHDFIKLRSVQNHHTKGDCGSVQEQEHYRLICMLQEAAAAAIQDAKSGFDFILGCGCDNRQEIEREDPYAGIDRYLYDVGLRDGIFRNCCGALLPPYGPGWQTYNTFVSYHHLYFYEYTRVDEYYSAAAEIRDYAYVLKYRYSSINQCNGHRCHACGERYFGTYHECDLNVCPLCNSLLCSCCRECNLPDCNCHRCHKSPCACFIAVHLLLNSSENEVCKEYPISCEISSGYYPVTVNLYMRQSASKPWEQIEEMVTTQSLNTFKRLSRAPGSWEVKVTAHSHYAKATDSRVSRVNEILPISRNLEHKSSIVANNFERLWNLTKTSSNENGRKEFGCFVYFNTLTADYECGNDTTGSFTPYPLKASMSFPPPKITPPNGPKGHAIYPVATFHTHPPATFSPVKYTIGPGGPSGNDEDYANRNRMPGIVYAYDDILDQGHDIDASSSIYYYGPERYSLLP